MNHLLPTVPTRTLSIAAFCKFSTLGRTRVYEEISKGRLRAVKAGRRTLILLEEAERWLQALEPAKSVNADGR